MKQKVMRHRVSNLTLAVLGSILFVGQASAEDLFAPLPAGYDGQPVGYENQQPVNYTAQPTQSAPQQGLQSSVGYAAPTFQQQQAASLNANAIPSVSISSLPVPTYVSDNARKAFSNATSRAMGLTPEQIRETKQKFIDKKNALNEDLEAIEVQTHSRTINLPLGVGAKRHVIRAGVGYSTAISVVDSTGRPWDVFNVTAGNGGAFDVMRLDGPEGSLFSIQAKANNVKSNIVFTLHEGKDINRKVPIVLDLVSGQTDVDDRLVLRIQGIGPNGEVSHAKLSQGVDSKYNAWLDGIVPTGVTALKTNSRFARAWKDEDGSFVLITKYHIYSPTSNVILSSSDGEAHLFKLTTNASVVWAKDPATNKDEKIIISGF